MKTCPSCGESLPARSPSPVVAAVLSFLIPGLGQMYRGDVATGFGWLIVTLIGYVLLIVPGLVLHIWCIVSAARPARPPQTRTGRTVGSIALGG